MASITRTFSYSPTAHQVVAEAIARENKAGNCAGYIRRAIEHYEAHDTPIEKRLAAIEDLLRKGIVPVMPDRLTEESEKDQMFDLILSEI